MNSNVTNQLKSFLENIFDGKESNKFFLIQHTVFERDIFDKTRWYMNCTLDTKNEGIYSVDVEFADTTNVKISSWKDCFDTFVHDKCFSSPGLSTPTKIYACDLYDNFVPRHYEGCCYTRGGFTGWNWFTVNIDDVHKNYVKVKKNLKKRLETFLTGLESNDNFLIQHTVLNSKKKAIQINGI